MNVDDPNNFQIISLDHLQSIPRKFKKNKKIIIDMTGTKYELIRSVASQFEWQQLEKSDKINNQWNIKWYDFYIQEEDLRKMLPFQKINHFPNSSSLGKKNNLGKYLHKLQKIFPNDYNYFPRTWILPYQFEQLRNFVQNKEIDKKYKVFIAKPDASCQGRGIFLFKKLQDIENIEHMIVQQYITNPYLIDGLKFDIRLYVLIKNLDPLKIFLYKDGLVRFATEPFKKPKNKNLDNIYMHLTNYAINKKNSIFKQNQKEDEVEQGHKRSFSSILKILKEQGNDIDLLMKKIRSIIVKTLAAVQPMMAHSYNSSRPKGENLEVCFEVLGFDIMIDSDMKPWLIEVNHTPSFQTDSALDLQIKSNLILDTLILLKVKAKDKKVYNDVKTNVIQSSISKQIMFQCDRTKEQVEAWENKNLNGYMRVFPTFPMEDTLVDAYNFIEGAKKIWDAWAGPKNKILLSQEKQNPQKPLNFQYKLKINQTKNQNQDKTGERRLSLYNNQKRPPSGCPNSNNQRLQNQLRPPSALCQRNNQPQTPQYNSNTINQDYKINDKLEETINDLKSVNNVSQDKKIEIKDQNKKIEKDQFKIIQNFLTSTNTLYNNYLLNVNQIQTKRNRDNKQIVRKNSKSKTTLQTPILVIQEYDKQNFKIQGSKIKQEIQIIPQEFLKPSNKKEEQKYTYKPKKTMDVAMLNELNKNFVSINSNQNIYMNE